jgi:hypothetical protein
MEHPSRSLVGELRRGQGGGGVIRIEGILLHPDRVRAESQTAGCPASHFSKREKWRTRKADRANNVGRSPQLVQSLFSSTVGNKPRRGRSFGYCSFAYSTFACLRVGISRSASFQSVRNSWYSARAFGVFPCRTLARARPRCARAPISSFCTTPG